MRGVCRADPKKGGDEYSYTVTLRRRSGTLHDNEQFYSWRRHIANGGVHSAIVGLTMSVDRARTLSAVLRGRFLVRSFPTVPAVRLNDAKRTFHQQAYRPLWSG
jgi:hypothetical protein